MKFIKLNKKELDSRLDEFIQILENDSNEYWGKEHFLLDLNEKWNYSLIVENNHIIIGYIIASKKNNSIHIHKFMVHNDSRSQGVGYKLLNKLEDICIMNGESLITLKVYKKNKLAIRFYLKNGFKIEKNRGDELMAMFKNLD